MKYLGKAADQRNPYAAYAYAKMCSERGDIAKAKEYFRIAVMYKPELGFRVGLWYYYEQNPREIAKALDLSIKQVENHLYRSRQKLRKAISVG